MASPLSPVRDGALNAATPETTKRNHVYEVQHYTQTTTTTTETVSPHIDEDDESSPFVSCLDSKPPSTVDQENVSPTVSPSKARHSRVRSGAELSPLKILSEKPVSRHGSPASGGEMSPPKLPRSPRKMSPEKRFPVKVSNPLDEPPSPPKQDAPVQSMSLDDAMRENEGLKHAIEIFEDEHSTNSHENNPPPPANADNEDENDDEAAGPDDTMVSTFSTFSAVPNMTMFAKLGSSPNKATPRARKDYGSISETPRVGSKRESSNTTNLLMDFTERLRRPSGSPAKQQPGGMPGLMDASATPNRRLSNLIDFDIPPMPTPRSIPSISAREVESLKSQFLSEISSLKASLSGKEAEVSSLKTAIGDAEKRVGESMEQLREEKVAKEQLAAEKEDWEKRGREMESVLRNVKEEMVSSEKEREELEQKLDESEKRREAAEMLHQDAESKMAGMRAGRESDNNKASSPEKAKSPEQQPPGSNSQEIEAAVERVARELHGLYKSKHETKVAALKKSYESRWQKKIKDLEVRIAELAEENDRWRSGHDMDVTRIESGDAEAGELKAKAVKDSAAMRELTADIQRLEAVVSTVQRDNQDLRGMLERERVEKGELVQLAEEMMSMQQQSFVGQPQQSSPQEPARSSPQRHSMPPTQGQTREQEHPHPDAPAAKTPKTSREGFRSNTNSVSRASGLRAPGSALRPPQERSKIGGTGGLPRPGGGSSRSGIMSSIEQMGSYRRRGGE